MPSIRFVADEGTPRARTVWLNITDQEIDDDGYLRLFSMKANDGNTYHYHMVRHTASYWAGLGAAIFGGATSLRSAKGLLQDFNKMAGKENWHQRAGYAGLAFGSAALLTAWLKTRPFQREGYYDSDHKLIISRLISTRSARDYDPND